MNARPTSASVVRADHLADADLPAGVGVGFKPMHFEALLADETPPAFVEVHAENYLGAGGLALWQLDRIRARMPISLHGVGLSLGGAEPPDEAHLDAIARVIERFQPAVYSEHLAWSSHAGHFYNDLLPIAYDAPALDRVCSHIDRVQERLNRRILLENPATYVEFRRSSHEEAEFLSLVLARTGCGLLLDVNNVYVSCINHARDPRRYLDALPLSDVGEIHLAGFTEDTDAIGARLLIDSHGAPVADPVWQLFDLAIERCGPRPTLIEWDNAVPDYKQLRDEARRAESALARHASIGMRAR